MYIAFEGTKRSVIPAPGLEKVIVVPAPVPTETDSNGLKYISVLSLALSDVLNPALIVNLLWRSKRVVVTVCAEPAVPSCPLKTLILLLVGSILRTFTFSSSIL